jgi:hypothetical protein
MAERVSIDGEWTDGPWAVDYGPDGGGHGPSLQVANGVEVICGWWHYNDTTRANARLISASPDMAAALLVLFGLSDMGVGMMLSQRFDLCRRALEKALGHPLPKVSPFSASPSPALAPTVDEPETPP